MKRYFLSLLIMMFLMSCSDDIKTNTPSMQVNVGTGFFHDLDAKAFTNEDGTITIAGEDGSRKLNLTFTSLSSGEYELGGNSPNTAVYTSSSGVVYSTDSLGDGVVKINSADSGGIYGSFNFNARVNGHTGDTLNFSQGALFGIPMADGSLDGDVDLPGDASPECIAATMNYFSAFEAFVEAGMDEEPSEVMQEKCAALKEAIEQMMDHCGELEDALQEQYDMLDCSAENWDDWDWDDF